MIEKIYYANELYIGKDSDSHKERLSLQHQALTTCKLIAYLSEMAMTHKCILPKQYEQIAKQTTDCSRLIGAWINSDKKRMPS